MDLDSVLVPILLILSATAIFVTFFERVGLGSVVGFLVAGVLIGPHTPGLVATHQVESLQNISELGVVLFLFTVGLEMKPALLWSMRRQIFGLGLLQVLISAVALASLLIFGFGIHWQSAVILGLGCAMSSTAVVMTLLAARGEMSTTYGRTSFAVLTAQDISIVPVMALIPVLAHHVASASSQSAWNKAALAFGVIAVIVIVGRYVLPAVLEWAARNRKRETFAIVLFLGILASAWGMDQVGISMTLGAFLLGMLLSASDGRYQILATVEPFKGLLMGLFFLAVGMSIDMQTLAAEWGTVLILIAAVLLIKTIVLLPLCRAFGTDSATSIRTAFSLSQVGELGFVLFTASGAAGLASDHGVTLGFLVIAGSMAVTPLMVRLGDVIAGKYDRTPQPTPGANTQEMSQHLVIVGFDNVGRLVALMAERMDVPYIAFDRDYQTAISGKHAGGKVYFGDILRSTVQEAASLAAAHSIFLSTSDIDRLKGLALTLHQGYPNLDIYARVDKIEDQIELRGKGIKKAGTTFIESTLFRGASLFREMGVPEDEVADVIADLRKADYALIQQYLASEGPEPAK